MIMVDDIIRELDHQLICDDFYMKDTRLIFYISSSTEMTECPFCGEMSSKVHFHYQLEIQDLPIHDRQTILLLDTKKTHCQNPACNHTTFSERFGFVASNGKNATRLTEKILAASSKSNSVSVSEILRKNAVKASKSTICNMLKKIPAIVNKPQVAKVRIDDFAFREGYSYGIVIVNLENYCIIDIIASQDTKEVAEWLHPFPNIEFFPGMGPKHTHLQW